MDTLVDYGEEIGGGRTIEAMILERGDGDTGYMSRREKHHLPVVNRSRCPTAGRLDHSTSAMRDLCSGALARHV